jgi:zinc protease
LVLLQNDFQQFFYGNLVVPLQTMIHFNEFVLSNGLQVIHYPDLTSPQAVISLLYSVGSRDETAVHTGLAHLFEHLMFSGSLHIPDYDTPLQRAGGTNNAFTNTDITNYYLSLPYKNIETGLWLESDRMLGINLSEDSVEVQKGVVIEEFKQRYLNQPYGDFWLLLRPLLYTQHPYNWATIGKEVQHIEQTTTEDCNNFFKRFYNPSNAILCVGGNIELDVCKTLVNKWFASIPAGKRNSTTYVTEPAIQEARTLYHYADVPQDRVAIAFHSLPRSHKDYYVADLLTDILGRSESSLLYNSLVREKKLFSKLSVYLSGELDTGSLVIDGFVSPDVDPHFAVDALWNEIEAIQREQLFTDRELQKVKNKAETAYHYGLTQLLNIAMSLVLSKNMGDAHLINTEPQKIQAVTLDQMYSFMKETLKRNQSVTLFYLNKNKQ